MSESVVLVKELESQRSGQEVCLVKRGEDYFVVSSIDCAPDHGGPETLAFPANEAGDITDWGDVAGGRGWTREETMLELAQVGPRPGMGGRGIFGDTKPLEERDPVDVFATAVSTLDGILKRALS